MTQDALNVWPIDALVDRRFVIPHYQRGYRWGPRQVEDLLEDIWKFREVSKSQDARVFYCLQPVVVKPDGDAWEVIDGQQRLTTIALILRSQADIVPHFGRGTYSLEYRTRERSGEFLAEMDPERRQENIDFYHMYGAYEAIEAWFAKKHPAERGDFLRCLLHPTERNVRIIWYQLPDGEDPVQAFVRLNVGKIPLTNSELIRALFLRRDEQERPDADPSRLQIAHEWDAIERRLRRNDVWGFLHSGSGEYPARIEYLFEIRIGQLGRDVPQHDQYATFIAYQGYFVECRKAGGSVQRLWLEMRQLSQRLDEWFDDRVLYHLVGTWIEVAPEPSEAVIVDLLRFRATASRAEFVSHLKARVFARLFGVEQAGVAPGSLLGVVREEIERLRYKRHDARIRDVLLLFNVASLLANTGSNLRFPFDLYKGEAWDLEHIKSATSSRPAKASAMRKWLFCLLENWPADGEIAEALRAEAERVAHSTPLVVAEFEALFNAIQVAVEEDGWEEQTEHSLRNLTLLDRSTNRSYQNAIFPLKRQRIIGLDKTGTFVPLCTTNVFLKYYSPGSKGLMRWTRADGDQYLRKIVETIAGFFTEGDV